MSVVCASKGGGVVVNVAYAVSAGVAVVRGDEREILEGESLASTPRDRSTCQAPKRSHPFFQRCPRCPRRRRRHSQRRELLVRRTNYLPATTSDSRTDRQSQIMRALCSWLLLAAALPAALAVKTEDFKTCSQSAFCRRGQALADRAAQNPSWRSPYTVDAASVAHHHASFAAAVKSSLYPHINFKLDVRVHKDGVVRVLMDEVGGLRKRYDETSSWALIAEPTLTHDARWVVGSGEARAVTGDGTEVVVSFDPLKVVLYRNGKEQVVLNGLGLLHLEHFRTKDEPKTEEVRGPEDAQTVMQAPKSTAWFEGEQEDGYWEETWKSWTDSKPKGECLRSHLQTCPYRSTRAGISFSGYQLPNSWSRLRYPSTCDATFAAHHLWRECVLQRAIPAVEFGCLRVPRRLHDVALRFHPSHVCTFGRLYCRCFQRHRLRHVHRRRTPGRHVFVHALDLRVWDPRCLSHSRPNTCGHLQAVHWSHRLDRNACSLGAWISPMPLELRKFRRRACRPETV